MSEHSLVVSFANKNSVDQAYWLRMELVDDDPDMTVGQAAELIDALFDTSLCTSSYTGENQSTEEPTGADWKRVFDKVNLHCDLLDSDGAYNVQIKVWRSDPSELYKLVMANGSVTTGPAKVVYYNEEVLAVDNADTYELDKPVKGGLSMAWLDLDNGPEIKRRGTTLYWDGRVTGTIGVAFNTEYDLVGIHVSGIADTVSEVITGTGDGGKWLGTGWYSGSEDGTELRDVQDIECEVLAFYHYQYQTLVLHKPELDESMSDTELIEVCEYKKKIDGSTIVIDVPGFGSTGYGVDACKKTCERSYTGDALAACQKGCEKECFKRVKYEMICDCGGEDQGEGVVDEPVVCPAGYNSGTYPDGHVPVDGGRTFIDCGHDSVVHLASYYLETCARAWAFDSSLPKCLEHHGGYLGKDLDDFDKAAIMQQYGQNANIIMVGPTTTMCGETITTQVIDGEDPCIDVDDVAFDSDSNPEVLPAGGQVALSVTGGLPPYTWRSVNSDVFFEGGAHSYTTMTPSVYVYANEDFCGSASIRCTDACSSSDDVTLRSTEGDWVYASDQSIRPLAGEIGGPSYGNSGEYFYTELTKGRWRQRDACSRSSNSSAFWQLFPAGALPKVGDTPCTCVCVGGTDLSRCDCIIEKYGEFPYGLEDFSLLVPEGFYGAELDPPDSPEYCAGEPPYHRQFFGSGYTRSCSCLDGANTWRWYNYVIEMGYRGTSQVWEWVCA